MAKQYKTPQEARRAAILAVCRNRYCSLGEICEALNANKNTIRSRYVYPMTREGLLIQEHPAGTKATQRYKAAGLSNANRATKED